MRSLRALVYDFTIKKCVSLNEIKYSLEVRFSMYQSGTDKTNQGAYAVGLKRYVSAWSPVGRQSAWGLHSPRGPPKLEWAFCSSSENHFYFHHLKCRTH